MNLSQPTAEIYVPFGDVSEANLRETTHLGICAHQDDLEILAVHGILECFGDAQRAFCGVVVTDGAGSARDYEYAEYTNEEMKLVRRREQKKAACVGEYAAQFLLDHPSAKVKDGEELAVAEDLQRVLSTCRPDVVYTHNLFDKHDTHVAVALRTIEALRKLAPDERPRRIIGCEVWRDLDWLPDELKVVMDVSRHENLQMALLGVFDSQIAGGKRYDLATMGRRKAHATFSESHGVDQSLGVVYGMDLTPLVTDATADPVDFAKDLAQRFADDVVARLRRFG